MKKIFLFVFVVVFFSGCAFNGADFGSIESKQFDVEKIKAMLDDPSVVIKEESLSAEQVSLRLAELNKSCGGKLSAKPYTLVSVSSSRVGLSVFVDKESNLVACTIREEKISDSCAVDSDCDDGLNSTVDKCVSIEKCGSADKCIGKPKACSNERIKECRNSDSFCPAGCFNATDSDCASECIADSDCNDQNALTSDACSGIIKACSNELILVGGRPLQSCAADADCIGENSCLIGVCSSGKTCSFSNETNGVVCGLKKECFGGECVDNALNKIKN